MFTTLIKNIAYYIIKKNYLKRKEKSLPFNNFFRNSEWVMIIMPSSDEHFQQAASFIDGLRDEEKKYTILLKEHKTNLLPHHKNYEFMFYSQADLNRLKLPGKNLVKSLSIKAYDVVIDLNIEEDLFCSAIANIVKSDFRIGMQKKNSDRFYNFQHIIKENSGLGLYTELLENLKMF